LVGKRVSKIIHSRNDALVTPDLNFLLPNTVALRTVSSTEAPLIFAGKKCKTVFLRDVTDRKMLEVDLLEWFESSTDKSISTIELSLSHDRWAHCTIKNLPAGFQIITLTEVTELKLAVDAAEQATEQVSQQINESVPDKALDTSSLSAILWRRCADH
tara:strand:+ start:112 stop:585 length:474 start_codon:yes stop_codon:yes gene_type:complete